MGFMFKVRNVANGNPFETELEDDVTPPCPQATFQAHSSFFRISIVIFCTVIVFILLIAGTATTAISYPPAPPKWKISSDDGDDNVRTALDGDYKLLGPLLLTSGCFLLIVDIILCAFILREAYYATRSIRPTSGEVPINPGTMSVLGGPFYLAAANPTMPAPNAIMPLALTRQLWTIPNAPTPDFAIDGGPEKGSRIRATTATLNRRPQPPYNPDIEVPKDGA